MIKSNVWTFFLLMTLSSLALGKTDDLIGRNIVLKVTSKVEDGMKYNKFEKCELVTKNYVNCKTLGNKDFYSLNELKSQRFKEAAEVVGSVIADLAIVGVGAYVSYFGAAGIFMTGLGGGSQFIPTVLMFTGAPAGIGLTSYLAKKKRVFNPIAQFRDQKALSSKIINDEDMLVSDKAAQKVIDSLDIVLQKI